MPAKGNAKPGPAPLPETTTIVPFVDLIEDDQHVNGVLSGYLWVSYDQNRNRLPITTVTYSFPNVYSDYGNGYSEANSNKFLAVGSLPKTAIELIFGNTDTAGQVPGFANLVLQEITDTANDANAQIRIGESVTSGSDGWTYGPGSGKGGDVWFNKAPSGLMSYSAGHPDPGDYTYTVFMHELGHALGLKHSFEKNPAFGVVPHDSLEYTVMSYDAYVGASDTWGTDGNNPQTYMMDDIAALQYMYGANYATHAGSTEYVWSPSTGALTMTEIAGVSTFEAPGTSNIFMTVWDGGGIDTYNFSSYATDLSVDLRPGGWTTLDTAGHSQLANLVAHAGEPGHESDLPVWAAGNIANALAFSFNTGAPLSGAGIIENATGGSGNDTIIGNNANNVLIGNQGNDTLTGGLGNDFFVFNSLTGVDTITDFTSLLDKLQFDNDFFAIGNSLVGEVVFGAAAGDSNDYIIYNQTDGVLSYDADGDGGTSSPLPVALLGTHPGLSFNDFAVV